MKKLIILVTALAMVVCFLPKTWAGETANLNLKVTFDLEGPYGEEPIDQIVKRIQELDKVIEEIASNSEIVYEKAVESKDPEEGIQELKSMHGKVEEILEELKSIAEKYGYENLDAKAIELLREVYTKGKRLLEAIEEYIAKLAGITPTEPVIAIELSRTTLFFKGAKLGETGGWEVGVANTGTVPVMVDIGYVQLEGISGEQSVLKPGTIQDVNTYATLVNGKVIPPDRRIAIEVIEVESRNMFALCFTAPTEITVPVEELDVSYELRAYPAEKLGVIVEKTADGRPVPEAR